MALAICSHRQPVWRNHQQPGTFRAHGQGSEIRLAGRYAPRMDVEAEIVRLKKELNAVILAHYYQESEIQDVADFVGDSLALAQQAEKTTADVIVFCGVHFMAETAKILNPDKLVLLPDLDAGCSLSDRCPPDKFKAFKAKYPDHFVATYVNSSAAIKGFVGRHGGIVCTSSNARTVLEWAFARGRRVLPE